MAWQCGIGLLMNFSQSAAARRLKINQPKISALAHYRLDTFPH
jgi:predicted XRE-type DNA-binding protein